MSLKLQDITDAESAALQPLLAKDSPLEGVMVVVEDTADLNTEIAKALSETGMMILLGSPPFENGANSPGQLTGPVNQQVLIGECPAIWRLPSNNNKNTCKDIARIVGVSLNGLLLSTMQRLFVKRGDPLGTFQGKMNEQILTFQYYRLEIETPAALTI